MSNQQKTVLEYIAKHPGCTAMDVCRYEWSGRGHRASYARVTRLRRRGLIRRGPAAETGRGPRVGLYVVT